MLPPNKMNHQGNLELALMDLGSAFNNQTALTTKRLTAIMLQLEKRFPGFSDDYNKQVFTIDIANIAGAIEQARRESGENALTIIKDNSEVLRGLKEGAKEKDKKYFAVIESDPSLPNAPKTTWLDAYNEGIKDAKAYGERLDEAALEAALEAKEDKS